jgi:hypothetical protein
MDYRILINEILPLIQYSLFLFMLCIKVFDKLLGI